MDGKSVPVVYGGTALKADGTLTGNRMAALIGLRDHARRVLQSQNEGWPEADRNDARRELNWAYDRFVPPTARSTKPPSAKPTTAPSSAGCPTWSNSGKTRTPCWSCRLEEYDEETGKAAKAPS